MINNQKSIISWNLMQCNCLQWMLLYLYCQLNHYKHILWSLNTLRPRQNGHHFPDAIFKCIFLNENIWILIDISLNVVPKGAINNIPASVQIMALHQPGERPLSEQMMVILLTHICVTRPQWDKATNKSLFQAKAFEDDICKINACQFCPGLNVLTHCDLVISNDDLDLGQHWPKPSPEPMMI